MAATAPLSSPGEVCARKWNTAQSSTINVKSLFVFIVFIELSN